MRGTRIQEDRLAQRDDGAVVVTLVAESAPLDDVTLDQQWMLRRGPLRQ